MRLGEVRRVAALLGLSERQGAPPEEPCAAARFQAPRALLLADAAMLEPQAMLWVHPIERASLLEMELQLERNLRAATRDWRQAQTAEESRELRQGEEQRAQRLAQPAEGELRQPEARKAPQGGWEGARLEAPRWQERRVLRRIGPPASCEPFRPRPREWNSSGSSFP
jgi:hypothetical protein